MSAPKPDRAGVPTPVPLTVVGDTPTPEGPAPTPIRGLLDQHRREIVEGSSVDPEVAAERGYFSLARPTNTNTHDGPEQRLKATGIARWARDQHSRYYPGWVAPIYRPTGERASLIWKPKNPATHPSGRKVKYVAPTGHPTHLDVHPRWSRTGAIVDPTVPLWITEGVKKADALTSRGICTIALSGVYMWRDRLAALGDWEDVQLRGREVWIAFDADAATNLNVLRAMLRLGRWLRSKHAAKIVYLIPPAELNGTPTKGVDDFLVAGGTVDQLRAAGTTRPPNPERLAGDTFTDARLAETIADDVLTDRFVWSPQLGWLGYGGCRWTETDETEVIEAARLYVLDRFTEAVRATKADGGMEAVDGWRSMTSGSRIRSVLGLARGIVRREHDEFDADPDVLNTPAGIVDLGTGAVRPHDPAALLTRITVGSYRHGYRHPDWEAALEALPEPERRWLQRRCGQAATGHPSPDGLIPVLHGDGENGKSLITGFGVSRALGDYADPASTKLLLVSKGEHSTEMADLRGQRFVLAEELAEGGRLDMTTIKRITDTAAIKARKVYRDPFAFAPTHTLLVTTNYLPTVTETDRGTWRRLGLLRFPFTFRKPGEACAGETDRRGDPTLKARMQASADGQQDAVVTWVVEGAMAWYADPAGSLAPTSTIAEATAEWRGQADPLAAFWSAHLVADLTACVLRSDLRCAYREFMSARGVAPLPEAAFNAAFPDHDVSRGAGVRSGRPRNLAGLSLRIGTPEPRGQSHVWHGIRFASANQRGAGRVSDTGSDQGKRESEPG